METKQLTINREIRESEGWYGRLQVIAGIMIIGYIIVITVQLLIFTGAIPVKQGSHNLLSWAFHDILFYGFSAKIVLSMCIVYYLYKFYLHTTDASFESKVKTFMEGISIPSIIAVIGGYGIIFLIANRTQIIELSFLGFSSVAIIAVLGIAFGIYHQTWTIRTIINKFTGIFLYVLPRFIGIYFLLFLVASMEFFAGYSFIKNVYSNRSGILYNTISEKTSDYFSFSSGSLRINLNSTLYIRGDDGTPMYDKEYPLSLTKETSKQIVYSDSLRLFSSKGNYIFIRPAIIEPLWNIYKEYSIPSKVTVNNKVLHMHKPFYVFVVLGLFALFFALLLLSFMGLHVQIGLIAIPHFPVFWFKSVADVIKKKAITDMSIPRLKQLMADTSVKAKNAVKKRGLPKNIIIPTVDNIVVPSPTQETPEQKLLPSKPKNDNIVIPSVKPKINNELTVIDAFFSNNKIVGVSVDNDAVINGHRVNVIPINTPANFSITRLDSENILKGLNQKLTRYYHVKHKNDADYNRSYSTTMTYEEHFGQPAYIYNKPVVKYMKLYDNFKRIYIALKKYKQGKTDCIPFLIGIRPDGSLIISDFKSSLHVGTSGKSQSGKSEFDFQLFITFALVSQKELGLIVFDIKNDIAGIWSKAKIPHTIGISTTTTGILKNLQGVKKEVKRRQILVKKEAKSSVWGLKKRPQIICVIIAELEDLFAYPVLTHEDIGSQDDELLKKMQKEENKRRDDIKAIIDSLLKISASSGVYFRINSQVMDKGKTTKSITSIQTKFSFKVNSKGSNWMGENSNKITSVLEGYGDGVMMLNREKIERFSSFWTNADNKKIDYISKMAKTVNNQWSK